MPLGESLGQEFVSMMNMEKKLKEKSLTERGGTAGEREEETQKKLQKLNEEFKNFSNTIDQVGNLLLIGKPEQILKTAGRKIDQTFSDMANTIGKTNPAIAALIKALQLGAKWFIGYQLEITKSNEMLISAERAMGVYNRTFEQTTETRKSLNKEIIRLEKELGVSSDDVKKRLGSMIAAGFKPAGESINELKDFAHGAIEWFTLLKEGMGLSDQAIKKFTKSLQKEFNLGMKESGSLIYSLSKNLTDFNVSQEEELDFYTDLINKGRDYGLTLDTIKKETDRAQKAGLSWSQTIRQISEMSMLGRQMSPERQVFFAQQMGSQGDAFQAMYEMTFGKMGKGKQTQADRMMGRVAEMAGLKPEELGQLKGGDVSKFAFYAEKLAGVNKETAMMYAMGNEEYKKMMGSLKNTPYEENKKQLKSLTESFSDAASTFTKEARGFMSDMKELFYAPSILKGSEKEKTKGSFFERLRETYSPKKGTPKGLKAEQQDFISRPGMDPIPFSSQDTIMGIKNPEKTMGGGGSVDINVQGAMMEGLEPYVKKAIEQFFEDKMNGM